MSTALLYCGTPEGFIIGADSRAFNKATEQIETDKEIKIFPFQNQYVSVVFAWSGIVKARLRNFDVSIIEESSRILPNVNYQRFDKDFNEQLRNRLSDLKVNTTGECAKGVFLYFWGGVAMGFEISAFKNGRTWDSCITCSGVPNGDIVIVSGGIEPTEFEKPISLNQAKNMMERYIQDCIADPQNEEIGGDPQIGKLTLKGFDWVIRPKLLQD